MKVFTAIPFLRILPPFLAGIAAGLFLHLTTVWFGVISVFCALLIAVSFYTSRYRRLAFFAGADLFLFFAGAFLIFYTDVRNRDDYFAAHLDEKQKVTLLVHPSDLAIRKENWRKCELEVTHVVIGKTVRRANGKLIGYFRYDTDSSWLTPGRQLLLTARLVPAQPPMNPGEFDYANWLSNRQIYHTVFVSRNDVTVIEAHSAINPIWEFGLKCRAWLLDRIAASGLDQQAYAICAALLTGQDDDIDRDTMSAFAHSGTLHVLSVSGLHTGLVYLALDSIFSLFAGKKRNKLLRLLIITVGLWAFALMTGFAAPVLRAVVMFNLVGIGNIYFRNHPGNQLNILFFSAFILLSWNPFFLFELGFMLSYLAMVGLICFTPPLLSLWTPANALVTTFWKSVCASFAATISTLPITLFFFKQFPLWFFICNLVVVPVSSVLLLFTVLLVFKIPLLAMLCNWLVHRLIIFIQWFNKPGLGYIDYLDFGVPDLVFCTLLVLIVSSAVQTRSFRSCASALVLIILWQVFSIFDSYQSKKGSAVTIYQVRKQNARTVKSKREVMLCMRDSTGFDFHVRPHLISYNYPLVTKREFNFVRQGKKGILFLDGLSFPGAFPEGTSTVVLGNNAALPPMEKLSSVSLVVCDGSNNALSVSMADSLCRKFGITFHNTATAGAAELVLK